MLDDSLFEDLKSELDKSGNIEKIQETMYNLLYKLLKPFRYIISLLIFLIVMTFILNVVNIGLNYYILMQKKQIHMN